MTLSLKDFGYQIKEIKNNDLVISFIKDILTDKSPRILSQYLTDKKITKELKEDIKNEITRDFMSKKNQLKLDLISLDKFINMNLNKIKKIEINFGLYKSSNKYKFGNGDLINHYVDLVNNLLLSLPNIKILFENFFEKCLTDRQFERINIFNTLQELENYNQIIFEEFQIILQKIVKKNYIKLDDNINLPKYLQYIDKFNKYQNLIVDIKRIYRYYFPKKKYSEVFNFIVEHQIKHLDEILTISIKMNSLFGLSFLEIYQKKLISNLKLVYNEKDNFFTSLFNKILRNYFNFIAYHQEFNIEKLVNIYYEEKENQKYNFILPQILSFLEKVSKEHKFHKKLNDYLIDNLDNKMVTDTISDWLVRMKNQEYFIISIQNYLSLRISELGQKKITNLINFFKKIKSDSVTNILIMLNDINKSFEYNQKLEKQKIHLFSPGVWDYVFQDEFINSSDISPDFPMLSELTELNDKVIRENSKLNLYLLKGNIKIKYFDEDKELIINCLPAQALLLKYLEDNSYLIKDIQDGLLETLTKENFDHLVETLINENLVFIHDDRLCLMKTLPVTGEINIAEKFFITTKLDDKVKDKIEKQFVLTIKEKLPAIIKHHVKKQDYTKDELLKILCKNYSVSRNQFEDIINEMINMEYIKDENDKLSNLI